jgi:23S rRNA U2552 (ribose-2'-O)-methylase RlmE/FtsJ
VAAGAEHLPVLRQFTGCRMVVDIGANRGQFARVARQCFPAARIVSFEPLPAPLYRDVHATLRYLAGLLARKPASM